MATIAVTSPAIQTQQFFFEFSKSRLFLVTYNFSPLKKKIEKYSIFVEYCNTNQVFKK